MGDPEVKKLENDKKATNITLAIPRSYKNADGDYDTDFVDCTLWNGVAEKVSEYCQKGDMMGIRGRLETNVYEKENGEKVKRTFVVAETVKFISSKIKDNDNEPELD